ncbi:polymeric immunoglobulin receptor-like isoform 2-T2 [Menidia menidia]
MSVHHTLLCLFFLSLQAANSSSAHGLELFYGHVGGDVTMKCSFSTSGRREVKFLCRENCDGGNKLIQTNSNMAEEGRYRIHYNEQVLSVSISGLTRSDSGRYRCAVGRASHTDVELVVAEALLEKSQQEPFSIEAGSSLTVGCTFKVSGNKKLFCRGDCWDGGEILVQTDGVRAEKGRYRIRYVDGRIGGGDLYVSITQLTQSDSGRYRCFLERFGPDGSIEFSIQVSAALTTYNPTAFPGASTPTATQSWSSSPGSPKPPGSSHSAEPPQGEGAASTDVLLIVGLSVAIHALLLSVALLVFCRRRSCRALRGLMSRKSEEVKLESCSPPTCEDPTYQSLSPGSRDQDQIYSTLTEHT